MLLGSSVVFGAIMSDPFTDADPLGTYREVHRAIAEGVVVKLRYYGGSQPGAVREVKPIAVVEGKLVATDRFHDRPLTFPFDRIAVVRPDVPASYVPKWRSTRGHV
jgi:predicted DNA-binding transcriptional regulator YafY